MSSMMGGMGGMGGMGMGMGMSPMMMGGMHGMNPMMGGMHGMGMSPMMMGGMHGMGMNPMMNPMMMGMHGMHHHMHPHGMNHQMSSMMHKMYGGGGGGAGLVGAFQKMGQKAGKINPMFNVNMGYMMGRAVKKCQPLKNGLEICALYNPMTNQLNIDVKAKNAKRLKNKNKRLFPKQLSKMIRMLVKQRVFGSAGHDLVGGELERRFGKKVALHRKLPPLKPPAPKPASAPKPAPAQAPGTAPAKGAVPAPQAATPAAPAQAAAPKEGEQAEGGDGVGNAAMSAMEQSQSGRRRLSKNEAYLGYDSEDLVQFDTMDGNIGYSMWRAELMDWHNFDDFDADGTDQGDVDFADYGEYRNFGNFVHYFDSFELDWNDQDSWGQSKDLRRVPMLQIGDRTLSMEMGTKCGRSLPMTHFKLCSTVNAHDISVFFRRANAERTFSGNAQYGNVYDGYDTFREFETVDGEDDYDAYFDALQMGTEFEANDLATLQRIIEYEFDHIRLSFNNDEDWHEIVTSYSSSGRSRRGGGGQRRGLMDGKGMIAGSRLGEHDHSETEISLFGRLYRLKGISKCGGRKDNPRFCVGIHLGEPIQMPKTISLPMSKMCNFMYIAKVCLGFDPNAMSLKLSIQFQSIHKWKKTAKRILDVIKHLPHKMKRYMKWANTASLSSARSVDGDWLQYDDDDEDEHEDDADLSPTDSRIDSADGAKALDHWYDGEGNEQWVISSAAVNADNLYWDDDDIWQRDTVMDAEGDGVDPGKTAVITTEKGRDVDKRCMHMMGGRFCLCQFLSWIDSPQYHCHPQQSSPFMAMMGPPVAAAKVDDLDVEDYMEMDMDTEGDDGHDAGGRHQEEFAAVESDYDAYSSYENEQRYGYGYGQDDGGSEQSGYTVDDRVEGEAEITDDFFYHKFNDYQSQMDSQWNAADFYDADYEDSGSAVEAVYDDEEEYIDGRHHVDSRWVKHADDPDELRELQHPAQQQYAEHDLFIYNNYDDDITYSQKQYSHPVAEQEEESADEWGVPVVWNGLDSYIEINRNLFWLLSLLAVFFGIVLCSVLCWYLKERDKFLELSKQMGIIQGIPIIHKCPGGSDRRYGFHAINVALSHSQHSSSDSDSDRSGDELIG